MTYFETFHQLKVYYKSLQEKGHETPIERAQGRLDSPVLFILPDFSSPFSTAFLKFLKGWFNRHGQELLDAKFHQTCCLSYRKGNSLDFSNEVLSNELRIIHTKFICSLLPLRINGGNTMTLTTIPYELFKSCNSEEIENFFETDGFRLEQELNQLFPLFSQLLS